ncbi:MAG: light-harvesting protein [Betaproteobacteria bacterium]|jgi:light-harvesting protein B-800-850 alpha chain
MTNGKMWLVVKPTVGIPVFFAGIVVAALSVHTAILLNSDWFPAFLKGGQKMAAAAPATAAPAAAPAPAAKTK